MSSSSPPGAPRGDFSLKKRENAIFLAVLLLLSLGGWALGPPPWRVLGFGAGSGLVWALIHARTSAVRRFLGLLVLAETLGWVHGTFGVQRHSPVVLLWDAQFLAAAFLAFHAVDGCRSALSGPGRSTGG